MKAEPHTHTHTPTVNARTIWQRAAVAIGIGWAPLGLCFLHPFPCTYGYITATQPVRGSMVRNIHTYPEISVVRAACFLCPGGGGACDQNLPVRYRYGINIPKKKHTLKMTTSAAFVHHRVGHRAQPPFSESGHDT